MDEQRKSDSKPCLPEAASQDAVCVKVFPAAHLQDVNSELDSSLMNAIHTAALDVDRRACSEAIQEAVASGVSRVTLAETYLPAVAQRMGTAWCEDSLSFADVTIGVTRLQSILRELGPEWIGDQSADANAPAIALLVLPDAFHTLGAMILSGILRRRGYSVRLILALERDDIGKQMEKLRFDAVFVSASLTESLEDLRKTIALIRKVDGQYTPVVIGGSIVNCDLDVAALTGADYVTSDPETALALCGLTPLQSDVPLRRQGR